MKPRVLVVEDNPANRELMTFLLKAFGVETLIATDGNEGVELTRRERPDLVLMDVRMPRLDGYDAVQLLKGDPDPTVRAIPVIAVTAFAMVGDQERMVAAGFDGYLSKPIMPESFLQDMRAYLPSLEGPAPRPEAAPAEPAAETHAGPAPLRGTILVVDDRPTNAAVVRSVLEAAGLTVETESTVRGALALVRRRLPDVILCDLHLLEETGTDLLALLRADEALRRLPFILTSASYPTPAERQRFLALGVEDFIDGPVEPGRLLTVIRRHLGTARADGEGRG